MKPKLRLTQEELDAILEYVKMDDKDQEIARAAIVFGARRKLVANWYSVSEKYVTGVANRIRRRYEKQMPPVLWENIPFF